MNGPISAQPGLPATRHLDRYFVLAAAVGISLIAISGKSLWIDEALTAWKAKQPTLTSWWQTMVEEKTSDLQMPLYMTYLWAYEKVFGSSEWALRAANLPWFALGTCVFIAALSSANQRRFAVALVVILSPFAWYCLNEARPYTMQLGASLFVFAALHCLSHEPHPLDSHGHFWVVGFFAGIVVLCGASLLGMIWAAAALAVAALILPPSRITQLFRSHRVGALIAGGAILLLGAYYLWTLKVGARAGTSTTTDWKNILFVGYELLGFSGLGPGRLEIRERGLNVFQPHWITLVPYGVTVLILLGAGWQWYEAGDRKKLFRVVLIIAAPAAVLMTAGFVMHFRVLGRHFAPVMPVVLFVLSTGVAALWSRGGRLRKLMVCGFFLLSLFSCLSLRFAARHEKDNYRDAAVFARAALQSGKQVWWNADNQGATYYQVPTSNQPAESGKAWRVINPSRELLSFAPKPEVIITSKPDLFDNQRALSDYIALTRFDKVATLSAFTIWKRSAK